MADPSSFPVFMYRALERRVVWTPSEVEQAADRGWGLTDPQRLPIISDPVVAEREQLAAVPVPKKKGRR